jgi:hypothetical protein
MHIYIRLRDQCTIRTARSSPVKKHGRTTENSHNSVVFIAQSKACQARGYGVSSALLIRAWVLCFYNVGVCFFCVQKRFQMCSAKMVANITAVFTQFEGRLRKLQDVPKFSHGRRMLWFDGAPNKAYLFSLFHDHTMAIEFLKNIGLIRKNDAVKLLRSRYDVVATSSWQ